MCAVICPAASAAARLHSTSDLNAKASEATVHSVSEPVNPPPVRVAATELAIPSGIESWACSCHRAPVRVAATELSTPSGIESWACSCHRAPVRVAATELSTPSGIESLGV